MKRPFLETRIPPPLVTVVAALLMWGIARVLPAFDLALPGRIVLAILAALGGFAVLIAGVIQFRRARTTVNPVRPESASALVQTGIYRLTRNPMYVGMAIELLAWGLFLANVAALGLLFAFVGYLSCYQIEPEERALRQLFGPDYDAYCAKVRRWI